MTTPLRLRTCASWWGSARSLPVLSGSSLCPPKGISNRRLGTSRRKRVAFESIRYPDEKTSSVSLPSMESPFQYSGESLDEYSEKASLSPWTPVPDSVARRIFDIAQVQSHDVHVELGSGDGRVNFFAIEAGAQKSVGVDIDQEIVNVAQARLDRIHPQPNIEFVVADLADTTHNCWDHLAEATIITMYFSREGLLKLKPILERKLVGKRCKIFVCGYPVPGWDPQLIEVVLDIPIHFYDWGNPEIENFFNDSIIPDTGDNEVGARDKFLDRKSSTYIPDTLKGYHPDDVVDYAWDDFEIDHSSSGDESSGGRT